jgi:putative acetyltransferase
VTAVTGSAASSTASLRVEIGPERAHEHDRVADVVRAAFARQPEVVDLVSRIRASAHYLPALALVARHGGAVVGHVMLSAAHVVDAEGVRRRLLTLSLLSVRPDVQRRGVGSALVRAVLAAADQHAEPLVVLEGSPAYYSRFGFRDCRQLGITMTLPDWASPEAGQAYPLTGYDALLQGRLVYPPAFDVLGA